MTFISTLKKQSSPKQLDDKFVANCHPKKMSAYTMHNIAWHKSSFHDDVPILILHMYVFIHRVSEGERFWMIYLYNIADIVPVYMLPAKIKMKNFSFSKMDFCDESFLLKWWWWFVYINITSWVLCMLFNW